MHVGGGLPWSDLTLYKKFVFLSHDVETCFRMYYYKLIRVNGRPESHDLNKHLLD